LQHYFLVALSFSLTNEDRKEWEKASYLVYEFYSDEREKMHGAVAVVTTSERVWWVAFVQWYGMLEWDDEGDIEMMRQRDMTKKEQHLWLTVVQRDNKNQGFYKVHHLISVQLKTWWSWMQWNYCVLWTLPHHSFCFWSFSSLMQFYLFFNLILLIVNDHIYYYEIG